MDRWIDRQTNRSVIIFLQIHLVATPHNKTFYLSPCSTDGGARVKHKQAGSAVSCPTLSGKRTGHCGDTTGSVLASQELWTALLQLHKKLWHLLERQGWAGQHDWCQGLGDFPCVSWCSLHAALRFLLKSSRNIHTTKPGSSQSPVYQCNRACS